MAAMAITAMVAIEPTSESTRTRIATAMITAMAMEMVMDHSGNTRTI